MVNFIFEELPVKNAFVTTELLFHNIIFTIRNKEKNSFFCPKTCKTTEFVQGLWHTEVFGLLVMLGISQGVHT